MSGKNREGRGLEVTVDIYVYLSKRKENAHGIRISLWHRGLQPVWRHLDNRGSSWRPGETPCFEEKEQKAIDTDLSNSGFCYSLAHSKGGNRWHFPIFNTSELSVAAVGFSGNKVHSWMVYSWLKSTICWSLTRNRYSRHKKLKQLSNNCRWSGLYRWAGFSGTMALYLLLLQGSRIRRLQQHKPLTQPNTKRWRKNSASI